MNGSLLVLKSLLVINIFVIQSSINVQVPSCQTLSNLSNGSHSIVADFSYLSELDKKT